MNKQYPEFDGLTERQVQMCIEITYSELMSDSGFKRLAADNDATELSNLRDALDTRDEPPCCECGGDHTCQDCKVFAGGETE